MRVQEKDIYHGAALTQIVEHPTFKALNKADDKYGHYLINTDRRLTCKYRKSGKNKWQFTFQPHEIRNLLDDCRSRDKSYLCLVCSNVTVCALDENEIPQVLDLEREEQQSVYVQFPRGGSLHVSGSAGKLKKTVPHNSFPDKVSNLVGLTG